MRTGRRAATVLLVMLALGGCDPAPGSPAPTPQPSPGATGAVAPIAPGCAAPDGGAGSVVQVWRTAAGGCVAPRRLVAARCGATTDPVIVLGIRRAHPSVFLGGRYAVPTGAVPDDAELLGVSGTERVWRSAAGDLLVEGAVVARWLLLPPREELHGGPPDAWMIGDSILDGARDAISTEIPRWTLTIDAIPARTATGGIAAATAASVGSEVVVMELGTNDADPAAYRSAVDAMSRSLEGVPLVLWVVPRSPKVSVDAISRTLREIVATYPNAATADWAAAAPEDAFSEDGVHLLPDRQDAFVDFLVPRLTGWTRAVRGLGATSCVAPIAAALESA